MVHGHGHGYGCRAVDGAKRNTVLVLYSVLVHTRLFNYNYCKPSLCGFCVYAGWGGSDYQGEPSRVCLLLKNVDIGSHVFFLDILCFTVLVLTVPRRVIEIICALPRVCSRVALRVGFASVFPSVRAPSSAD